MARAPSAKVSKTSGQGVSRHSYQKGRALGTGAVPAAASVKGEGPTAAKSTAAVGKSPKAEGDMNVSYGDTLPIGDLETVEDFGKATKQGRKLSLSKGKPVSYAKEKGDKGSGFNLGKRR